MTTPTTTDIVKDVQISAQLAPIIQKPINSLVIPATETETNQINIITA